MNRSYSSIIISFVFIFLTGYWCFATLWCMIRASTSSTYFACSCYPVEISAVLGMVIAFATGSFVDLFYHTIGVHAAASVLVMFFRSYCSYQWTRTGYEVNQLPTIPNYGIGWYLTYALPLIFIHALTVFIRKRASAHYLVKVY